MTASKFQNTIESRRIFTPDFKDLDQYDKHLVMVYDNHKNGFFSHKSICMTSEYMGVGLTIERDFTMRRNASFPFVIQNHSNTELNKVNGQQSKIWGEVYALNTFQLASLDTWMNNNVDMFREKKYIELVDQPSSLRSKQPPVSQCWVYLCEPSFFLRTTQGLQYGVSMSRNKQWGFEWTTRPMVN